MVEFHHIIGTLYCICTQRWFKMDTHF